MLLDTSDIVPLHLQRLIDILKHSYKPRWGYVRDREKVTDANVSALAAGYGQLQSIDLSGCIKVTDKGIKVLGQDVVTYRASIFRAVSR